MLPPGLPGNIWSRIVRYYDCYSPLAWTLAWTLVWLINLKVKVTIVNLRLPQPWSAALSTSLSY